MPDALAAVLADPGLPFVCLVSLIAGLVYGFAGFGSALIFMPLATLFVRPPRRWRHSRCRRWRPW
jgi:hypothetical protein